MTLSLTPNAARNLINVITEFVKEREILINRYNQFGFSFAWSDGSVENSAKVVSVTREGNTFVMKYDWYEGELRGTLQGKMYSGTWIQKGARPGSGRFDLTFADDFSKATGWWDRGAETTKQAASIR